VAHAKKGDARPPLTGQKGVMKNTHNIPGAGVILFRFRSSLGPGSSEPEFLLLKGRDTGVWSFPKGHPEESDNDEALRTATRETYEETGYIYDKDYHICGGSIRFGKRPYWVGFLTTTREVRLTSREHQTYGWFTRAELAESGISANLDVRGWLRRSSVAFQEIMDLWRPNSDPFSPCPDPVSLERPGTHSTDEENIEILS
jgi:8-oxo-dGTP pyrophosphatase MutT (NUDIX family)